MAQSLHRLTEQAEFAPVTLAKADGEAWAKLGKVALEPAAGSMPAWLEPQIQVLGSSAPPIGLWQKGKLLGVVALEQQNARWLPGCQSMYLTRPPYPSPAYRWSIANVRMKRLLPSSAAGARRFC